MSSKANKEVFEKGSVVLLEYDISSEVLENFCQTIAARSGQQVDWWTSGNCDTIAGLGDLAKIRQTIKDYLPEYNKIRKAYCMSQPTWKNFHMFQSKEIWGPDDEISAARIDQFVNRAYPTFSNGQVAWRHDGGIIDHQNSNSDPNIDV